MSTTKHLKPMPENVTFNNEGDVYFNSLVTMPENIIWHFLHGYIETTKIKVVKKVVSDN